MKKIKHLTFIKPNIGRQEHSLYVDEGRMEPLMLAVLAGLTPDDIEVKLFDDRFEEINYDIETDAICITIETYTARRSYEIADEFRLRGKKVIMGGMHALLIPEEVLGHADSILIGDAEVIWESMLKDLAEDKLLKIYRNPTSLIQVNSFGKRVVPRRSIFENKTYLPMTLMQFSRGCKFTCNFCAIAQFFDKKHLIREIDSVIEEIANQDRKFLFFIDDNIAMNRPALKELCVALKDLKLGWISQASLDSVYDSELMKLMQQAGNWGNVIGFESINENSLEQASKKQNLKLFDGYRKEIQILRDHGMQTWAAFILGLEGDTEESIRTTVDFALESKFAFAAFNILMPYPGTPLYDKLKMENRLLYDDKWWLHPEYRFNHAAYIPKNMTPEQLTAISFEARKKFNSIPSLMKRFSDPKTNMQNIMRAISFLKYAFLFRKEVFKKQSMKFGLK